MNSKKVLIVTHHYLNGNGGGVFASRAYINAFAEIYSDVTLLYPVKEGHPIEHINKKVKAIPVKYDVPKIIKLWHVLTGLSHRYFDVFEKTLIQDNYDTVVFDTSNVTWKLIDIAHKHHAKVITIHHNFQMEYDRDNTSPILRLTTLYWTRKREGDAVVKSDLNLTLTKPDRELLYKNYDTNRKSNIQVLGCFEYEQNNELERGIISTEDRSAKRFVITGNLSARQTENSLKEWLDDYYPILKEECPQHSLTIAGKKPSHSLQVKCSQLGTHLIPSPDKMGPILDKADYYICPTSLGGGLKLRIMDGARRGLLILTHDVSARGYEGFKEKQMLFSYNSKYTFRSALKSLITTSATKEEISNYFKKEFSFEAGIYRLKKILVQSKHI